MLARSVGAGMSGTKRGEVGNAVGDKSDGDVKPEVAIRRGKLCKKGLPLLPLVLSFSRSFLPSHGVYYETRRHAIV